MILLNDYMFEYGGGGRKKCSVTSKQACLNSSLHSLKSHEDLSLFFTVIVTGHKT